MISGKVVASERAVIPLLVRGTAGIRREIEAVIDTGFDGWLSLSPSLILDLGLVWQNYGRALLADGSESVLDVYEAVVQWDGAARRISVDCADTVPLVGMALMKGYELTIEVLDDGKVPLAKARSAPVLR
jgi:clan AA aspartic protease